MSFVTLWMELDDPGIKRQLVHELTLTGNLNRLIWYKFRVEHR